MNRIPSSTADVPPLALDLSSAAIRLMGRNSDGAWEELGAARPGAADFARRIDDLRVEALARGRGPVPVDLWLPPDQVLVRHYQLSPGARGRAEAVRRLSAETGLAPDELLVAIAAPPAGEAAVVLAVPSRIVAEARAYAQRWGFWPGRVSTRVRAGDFGASGPSFAPAPLRLSRTLGTVAAGATAMVAVVLGIAVGGFVGDLAGWPGRTPAPVTGSEPELAAAPVNIDAPGVVRFPFTRVERDPVQALAGAASTAAPAAGHTPHLRAASAPVVGEAPQLATPSDGVTMQVGSAPALPRRVRPDRLQRQIAAHRPSRAAKLVRGIDRIRDAARELATVPTHRPVVLAAAIALPPASGEPAGISDASLLPGAGAGAGAAPAEAADSSLSADGAAPAATTTLLAAAGDGAPRTVPVVPPPRPDDDPAAGTAPKPPASDIAVPAPRPEDAAAPSSEAAEAPAAAAAASDLAATATPLPPDKPADKARRSRRAVASDLSPVRVREAAEKHGLELDSTSLIGVLDAKSGRQALLRVAAGEYVKVGRGDTVEGWRVKAISRDSVRLTHGSRTRTLLLVAR